VSLDDDSLDPQELLDVWKLDPNFSENEATWEAVRQEILGVGEGGEGEAGATGGGEAIEAELGDDGASLPDADTSGLQASAGVTSGTGGVGMEITDMSETDLINLRRTIYLTIMASLDFEECAHKLVKLHIPRGAEMELCNMFIECCSQERTFLKYYGFLGQRFCMLSALYQDAFESAFGTQFATIHRLETNKLRNVAKFFAHLLHTDALPWTVFEYIHLNEDETSPASRIFIKILMQVGGLWRVAHAVPGHDKGSHLPPSVSA
jgi:pre-mRNA-splicing factor CWC22